MGCGWAGGWETGINGVVCVGFAVAPGYRPSNPYGLGSVWGGIRMGSTFYLPKDSLAWDPHAVDLGSKLLEILMTNRTPSDRGRMYGPQAYLPKLGSEAYTIGCRCGYG